MFLCISLIYGRNNHLEAKIMQIPSIATALSSSLTSISSCKSTDLKANPFGDDADDDHLVKHDRETIKSRRASNMLSKPFDMLVPGNVSNQLAYNFIRQYTPTSIIESYSDGIILINNATNSIYLYDYDSLQLSKIIKLSNSPKIIEVKVISNLLLLLTDDHQLILFDPISCTTLFKLQFSYHFTTFKKIINLDNSSMSGQVILALYTSSSCTQLVNVDLINLRLSLLSPLIYLPFWPIAFLSIESTFFYFFNSLGEYQVYTIADQEFTLLSTIKNSILLTSEYGKLKDIKILNDSDSFIFLQENGWTIYQYQQLIVSDDKKIPKLTNSLNNLQTVISSPLSSSFEKLIQCGNNSYILMTDRNLTLISGNHIRFIESTGMPLLDIILNRKTSNVIGIFNTTFKHKSLKEISTGKLNWIDINVPSTVMIDKTPKLIYSDSNFNIIGESDRMILKNLNGLEIGTLFDLDPSFIHIIDLNWIIPPRNESLKYFLLYDAKCSFQLIILNSDITLLLNTIKISSYKNSNGFYSVCYFDREGILEFCDEEGKYVTLDIYDLQLSNKTLLNSTNSKFIIFDSTGINIEKQHRNTIYCGDIFDSLNKVHVKELKDHKEIFDFSMLLDKWIGISDNNQTVFHKIDPQNLFNSPELFLLYTTITKDLDLNMIDLLIKSDNHLFTYVTSLTHFITLDNSLLSESAISILYSLLLKDNQIVDTLYDKCILNGSKKLENIILMIFCISIDHNLIAKYNTRQIFNYIVDYVLLMNERICEICIDVLSKLSFEDFLLNEGDGELGTKNFDLIEFFKNFFFIRSVFFNDKGKRNFKNFQRCNNFLDSLLEDNLIEFCTILFTIIESDNYGIENKKNVLDYIIYVFLEKIELIKSNEDCTMVLYLLINSLISYLSQNEHKYNKKLKNNDSFWESISLLFNILSTNFKYLIAIKQNGTWKELVYEDDKKISICLVLNILGYVAIIYRKMGKGGWQIQPMKSSEANIPRLDTEIGNSEVDIKAIRNKLMKNEMNANGMLLNITNPIFLNSYTKIGLINLNRLSIQVWNLEEEGYRDNLGIDVLRNESIPLKVPDFNMLLLQYVWARISSDSQNTHSRDKEKRIDNERFTKIVERLHSELVHKAKSTPVSSPLTSPKRKFSGFTELPYSDLETVSEPVGELQFGFLLESYLGVFPALRGSDVEVAVFPAAPAAGEASVQLQLLLQKRAVFLFAPQ